MSTIRVDNFGPSAGGTSFETAGIAKAYAMQVTDAGAVSSSNNISSVTDTGTGSLTFAFSNGFANTLYGNSGCTFDDGRPRSPAMVDVSASECDVNVETDGGNASSFSVNSQWWGELA